MKTKILGSILACLLIVSLVGCATLTNLVDTAQQLLCNPTVDQKAAADNVMNFLATGSVFVVPLVVSSVAGAAVTVTPDQAKAAFMAIQAGLCVGATDLQLALQWFDAVTAIAKAASMTKAISRVPNTAALWNMLPMGK